MYPLFQRSIDILLANQTPEGAYLACPNFPAYHYAWFRDGSFCAYALDSAGQRHSARRFHQWAAGTVLRHQAKIARCIALAQAGVRPDPADYMHPRFTPDGAEVPGHWGHHQLDGLGTWLWALGQHLALEPAAPRPVEWTQTAALVRDYLVALWRWPCSDCWEEHEGGIHTYTLAAVYAGLKALEEHLGDDHAGQVAAEVQRFILAQAVCEGQFVKSLDNPAVDANLLALAVPYAVVSLQDARMQATLRHIETLLAVDAGLCRYAADTYYGGGQWLLLSAWLGWCRSLEGRMDEAIASLRWIEAQATADGELPEQTPAHLNAPERYPEWIERWGPVASPLLWSHAMYLILSQAIQASPEPAGRQP